MVRDTSEKRGIELKCMRKLELHAIQQSVYVGQCQCRPSSTCMINNNNNNQRNQQYLLQELPCTIEELHKHRRSLRIVVVLVELPHSYRKLMSCNHQHIEPISLPSAASASCTTFIRRSRRTEAQPLLLDQYLESDDRAVKVTQHQLRQRRDLRRSIPSVATVYQS